MTVTNVSRLSAKKFPALDDFRLLAVILVVANHTRSADDEFLWLLTVLHRVSVPFFIGQVFKDTTVCISSFRS